MPTAHYPSLWGPFWIGLFLELQLLTLQGQSTPTATEQRCLGGVLVEHVCPMLGEKSHHTNVTFHDIKQAEIARVTSERHLRNLHGAGLLLLASLYGSLNPILSPTPHHHLCLPSPSPVSLFQNGNVCVPRWPARSACNRDHTRTSNAHHLSMRMFQRFLLGADD